MSAKQKHTYSTTQSNKAADKLSKKDWSLYIALSAVLLSIFTFALTRYEAWDQNRAKYQKAEYLSYRLGVIIGEFEVGSQYKDIKVLEVMGRFSEEILKNAPSLIRELGLGVEIPDKPDGPAMDVLYTRLRERIRDFYGQRAVNTYILGFNVGQCKGALLPYAAKSKGKDIPFDNVMLSVLNKMTAKINAELIDLGFETSLQMDSQSVLKSYEQANKLDRTLVFAWNPRESVWNKKLKFNY